MKTEDQPQDPIAAYIREALSAERFAQATRDAGDVAILAQRAASAEALVTQLSTKLATAVANAERANAELVAKKLHEEEKIAAAKKAEEVDWAQFKTIGGCLLIIVAGIIIWRMMK